MQNNDILPYFSVIIPQKNRSEYLVHTLRTCMIQDYPNFEIIVSDDCSDDDSVKVVEELMREDSRIKLFAHKDHLGMRDNFEFALNQVRPGYVMALGGDDGLLPGAITEMYRIIKETGAELLTWNLAYFTYPTNGGTHNILRVPRTKGKEIEFIKSECFLNKIAKTFQYQVDDCPMFYMKGVASTELVNRVKSRTPDGCFYYCPTPDGFSGVVLAGEVDQYVYCKKPLSIGGDTEKSQGKNYGRTDKKSRFEAQQFFNDNIRRTMHPDLASQPYSPLTTLMTADYLLTARDLSGWPGRFNQFKFEDLLRAAFKQIENTSYQNEVLERELLILKEIAIKHNLLPLFKQLYTTTKHKLYQNTVQYGFAITNSIRMDGSELGIHNIFDAALAVNFIYNFYKKFSFKTIYEVLTNNLNIVLQRKKYSYEELPSINID